MKTWIIALTLICLSASAENAIDSRESTDTVRVTMRASQSGALAIGNYGVLAARLKAELGADFLELSRIKSDGYYSLEMEFVFRNGNRYTTAVCNHVYEGDQYERNVLVFYDQRENSYACKLYDSAHHLVTDFTFEYKEFPGILHPFPYEVKVPFTF